MRTSSRPLGLRVSEVTPEPLLGTGGHRQNTGSDSGRGGGLTCSRLWARGPSGLHEGHGTPVPSPGERAPSSTLPMLGQWQQCLWKEGDLPHRRPKSWF